jgi:hypothetical protein
MASTKLRRHLLLAVFFILADDAALLEVSSSAMTLSV